MVPAENCPVWWTTQPILQMGCGRIQNHSVLASVLIFDSLKNVLGLPFAFFALFAFKSLFRVFRIFRSDRRKSVPSVVNLEFGTFGSADNLRPSTVPVQVCSTLFRFVQDKKNFLEKPSSAPWRLCALALNPSGYSAKIPRPPRLNPGSFRPRLETEPKPARPEPPLQINVLK